MMKRWSLSRYSFVITSDRQDFPSYKKETRRLEPSIAWYAVIVLPVFFIRCFLTRNIERYVDGWFIAVCHWSIQLDALNITWLFSWFGANSILSLFMADQMSPNCPRFICQLESVRMSIFLVLRAFIAHFRNFQYCLRGNERWKEW